MIAGDSVQVFSFFAQLVSREDFQIVQKIESNSYWIFVHALSDEVKSAALKVEKAIADNREYAIYRTLIGFEGIFGDWSTYERKSQQFEAIEEERRKKASDYARSITADTYAEWRARILEYAKTESDDLATFPVFYHFFAEFATARPELAQRLVTEDTTGVARFSDTDPQQSLERCSSRARPQLDREVDTGGAAWAGQSPLRRHKDVPFNQRA